MVISPFKDIFYSLPNRVTLFICRSVQRILREMKLQKEKIQESVTNEADNIKQLENDSEVSFHAILTAI